MFCQKCGNELVEGAAFCGKCGASLRAQPDVNVVAQQPTYIVTGKIVNQVAYAVLAIVLGDLGVHKFYSGKIGMGILYLLFCWTFIPGVIGFIEGIIAITKEADVYGNIIV